jgi:hypothetical protein
VPQKWIINSQDECKGSFDDNFEIRLGIDDTFKETSAIFGLIGLSFGASAATKIVDSVTWAYTVWWKRLLRGVIGIILYVGIFVAFAQIPRVDLPTAYFFNGILPHLFATYLMYGVLPVAFKYIGLVQSRKNTDLPPSKLDKKEDRDTMKTEYEEDDPDESEEEKTPGDFYTGLQSHERLISESDKME